MAGEKAGKGKDKPKDGEWTVFDSNAFPTQSNPTGEREHLTRDRTPYKLHHRRPTPMPMKHAVDFLCDEAFKVYDENADLVPHIKPAAAGAALPKLQPDQAIVSLNELSDQALLVRAQRVNSLATKDLGREKLIDLIVNGGAGGEGEGEDEAAGTGGDAELAEDE